MEDMKAMENEVSKCIIWGIGGDYEKILNQVLFEIYKKNISVEALVCKKEDKYCISKDGFRLITKKELWNVQFEYIIIASHCFFCEIKKEAMECGIEEKRIINGKVFELPLFDFGRYRKLIENPVTILADDCWAGYVYNRLCLPFSSPLINIAWDRNEYSKFILDPLFYLSTELELVSEGDLKTGIFPIGKLGIGEKSVTLKLVHNTCFEEAKAQWDKRKKRINPNNLFVKMGFKSSEENCEYFIESFSKVKENKVLFYNGDNKVDRSFYTERYIWEECKGDRANYYDYNDYVRATYYYEMDILKLLTSEEIYTRETYLEGDGN